MAESSIHHVTRERAVQLGDYPIKGLLQHPVKDALGSDISEYLKFPYPSSKSEERVYEEWKKLEVPKSSTRFWRLEWLTAAETGWDEKRRRWLFEQDRSGGRSLPVMAAVAFGSHDFGDWRAAHDWSGLRHDGGVGPVRSVPVLWLVVV
ncbi:hypothetical protein L3X38_026012 [Prunus dulcis]|uniref:Uncharacterized protein n=1 Tax=Prunus dulcis TaxID=3755 RepID=A0AAD4W3Y0_PRUDU|nr:hypothetical protein L3X38_026012 [Prunus dulcis]